jgi:hypothetical protein
LPRWWGGVTTKDKGGNRLLSDFVPIIFDTPREFEYIELYLLHDIHKGSAQHDERKWNEVKREILAQPNRYALFVGDAMENATPGSKSDMFTQTIPPHEQKEWFTEQLIDLAGRTIGVTDGNHEKNRSTKMAGLYPLYDCCVMAGIKERYRPHFLVCDIGVGTSAKDPKKQIRYVGCCIHKAKDLKAYSTADALDGIDFFVYGHDHDPKDHPRAKLVYDAKNKKLTTKSVEVINSGAFLTYGGYAADSAYRPVSDKLFKIVPHGGRKNIKTVGFYV